MKRILGSIILMLALVNPAFAFIGASGPTGGGGGGGGTVTSVSGTANQVGVATGTTTPVISLIGPYTPATYTAHGILLGEGTASISQIAVCANGSFPYGQTAADPVCSTLIMPNAATTGVLLTATSPNTIGSLADVAVGQVLTSGGVGTVPAYSATLPAVNGAAVTALNATNISSGTAPAANGGTGTAYGAPACNSGGAITNAGTVTPSFLNTNCYVFSIASPSNAVTFANPTNLPTNAMVAIGFSQAAAVAPSLTWPSAGTSQYWGFSATTLTNVAMTSVPNSSELFYPNSVTGVGWTWWWSDGTNLTLLNGAANRVNFDIVDGNRIGFPGDSFIHSWPRQLYSFSTGNLTLSGLSATNFGVYLVNTATNITNIVGTSIVDTSCAAGSVITIYDCGASAPSSANCSSGTALANVTLSTTVGQAVAGSVTHAAVAAGEYIGAQISTIGTSCTVLNANIDVNSLPQ